MATVQVADMNNAPPAIPLGLGALGNSGLVFKRKFRWTMSIGFCDGTKVVPQEFVKVGARPQLDIEETEINYLHGKTWIPGKASWEAITVTYYDVATKDNVDLWSWIASVYDFTSPDCLWMNSKRSGYAGVASLYLLDGCGNPVEFWQLGDVWPTSVKFGDLDYANSETVDIEVTLRYSSVSYIPFCGGKVERCPCSPCGS